MMYFGLGFLLASLIGLVFIPLVHRRAERLTVRRLGTGVPLSVAELQADKDQLRAEFAVSARRLEMNVEQMKAKSTGQLAELSKKNAAVTKLRNELGEKNAAVRALEGRERAVKDQLRTTEDEVARQAEALRELERKFADKEAERGKLAGELDERTMASDSQRIEMIALNTQIEAIRTRVHDTEQELAHANDRIARQREEAKAAAETLATERAQAVALNGRIGELGAQLTTQHAEADQLRQQIGDLETRLGERERLLVQRAHQLEQVNAQLAVAHQVGTELREEMAAQANRHDAATQAARSQRALLQGQLDRANEERAKIQREFAAAKRGDSSQSAEQAENAALREQINNIAAEIASLTATLEGPHSTIEQLLAVQDGQPAASGNGSAPPDDAGPTPSLIPSPRGGNLADRIRALQKWAAGVPTPG
jgi:chromosome segregation ATPase